MVIRGSDRVATVLGRDEGLVEVFAAVSPHFERLRDPGIRRVMTRLVTVSAAARIAGVDEEYLLARLNAALRTRTTPAEGEDAMAGTEHSASGGQAVGSPAGYDPAEAGGAPSADRTLPLSQDPPDVPIGSAGPPGIRWGSPPDVSAGPGEPAHPSALPFPVRPDRVVELDVREDLRRNQEPFSRIMAAVNSLPSDHVLRLRTTFEPVPLYNVLAKKGLRHATERLGEGDWCVWFFRDRGTIPEEPELHGGASNSPAIEHAHGSATSGVRGARDTLSDPAADPASADESVVVLDVRGLEPPEPMVRTLAALETLPHGSTLLQLNVRVPEVLLPRLADLGFEFQVVEDDVEDVVRTYIRRGGRTD